MSLDNVNEIYTSIKLPESTMDRLVKHCNQKNHDVIDFVNQIVIEKLEEVQA